MTKKTYRATTTTLIIVMLTGGLLLGIGPIDDHDDWVGVDPDDIEATPGDPNDPR